MKTLLAVGVVVLGVSLISANASRADAPALAFDPAVDCAAMPHGLSPGVLAGDDSNDAVPQIPADQEPEFLPADMISDIFLQFAKPVLHEQADLMIQDLTAVCTSKKDHALQVAFYFKDFFSLKLKPVGEARTMETYRADFPTVLKASITKAGNLVTVDFQGRRGGTLQLMAKVPVLSDRIYLHRLVINTDTKWMQIFAGTMKDKIGVVAWSHFDPGAPIVAQLSLFQTLRHLLRPVPPKYITPAPAPSPAPTAKPVQ